MYICTYVCVYACVVCVANGPVQVLTATHRYKLVSCTCARAYVAIFILVRLLLVAVVGVVNRIVIAVVVIGFVSIYSIEIAIALVRFARF